MVCFLFIKHFLDKLEILASSVYKLNFSILRYFSVLCTVLQTTFAAIVDYDDVYGAYGTA